MTADRGERGAGGALEWEAAFIAESVVGRPCGPYLPHDLVVALDRAPVARVEAFLTGLEAHAGEDMSAAELWARWEADVVMVAHVLPGGETIEIDGSTVDDPETGEPRPAAVLRLPVDRLRGVADALDLCNRMHALVTGRDVLEEELSTALTEAADTLADPDRAATQRARAPVDRVSGSAEEAAARAELVEHAYTAALAWLRAVTWSRPAPRAVFTGLKAAAARLRSGEDAGDPARVLVQFAIAALADTDSSAAAEPADGGAAAGGVAAG